jgi:ATP-binding cassette subfamily F protein 3
VDKEFIGDAKAGDGVTVGYLSQEPQLDPTLSVLGNVELAVKETKDLLKRFDEVNMKLGEPMSDEQMEKTLAEQGRLQEQIDAKNAWEIDRTLEIAMDALRCPPPDADVTKLSGGEKRRVALCRILLERPDLLLLDEPTNHLDLDTTRWLEKWLREQQATLLVVSHDRSFLRAVADHVLHVEAGTMTPYDCGYEAFVHLRNERRMAQQKAFDKQRKVIAAEQDFIARNIAGINSTQAKGRRRRLERVERLAPPPGEEGSITLRLQPGDRGGDQVMVADGIRLAQGERELVHDFNASVRRGDVIALVGSNGTGKSTLLRVLAGDRSADGGEVRIPQSVAMGYYRQDLSQVPPDDTLFDNIANRRTQWTRGQIQAHLGRFGFSGDSVLRKARSLSGGERARMALALLELDQANLLLIDEPTNHLDVETIEALEEGLEAYEGTLILVSHDRALLNALATRVWALVDGVIEDYPGTFEEWEQAVADRRTKAAAAARAPVAKRAETSSSQRDAEAKKAAQNAVRNAQRALAAAEDEVAKGEADVRRLERELEAPGLYEGAEGAATAKRLAQQLADAKRALASANARWEAAMAAADGVP